MATDLDGATYNADVKAVKSLLDSGAEITYNAMQNAVMVLGIVLCMLLLVVILESTGWRKDDE